MIKKEHPNCKVAFIGPCAAKKLEASRRSVRSDVDFVLTFEEVMGMFEAREVDFENLQADAVPSNASADGRGFSVSGGVAEAVANCIRQQHPEREILIERAEGLNDCRKMLMRAKAGKLNGYLLEGMACPGGCIGGAGTVQLIPKAATEVENIKKLSAKKHAYESTFSRILPDLEE
jgi:iron only hydrogenase large subunit-like protein